jgi:hypothetical protein
MTTVGSSFVAFASQISAFQGVSQIAALSQVQSAVSQLVQAIGGGVQNDKMLQALIALLIVMALLENADGPSVSSAQSPVAGLSSESTYVGIYSSSTTVTLEYSSLTAPASLPQGQLSYSSTELTLLGNQQIDLAA